MKHKYLYIDDNPIESSQSLIDVINGLNIVSIAYEKASSWTKLLDFVDKHSSEINGIIIDWKLNEFVEDVNFKTESFIQELRTRMAEDNGISAIPIVLCSANPDFANKYFTDNLSHDLFDLVVDKVDLVKREFNLKLLSLSLGYERLRSEKDVSTILSCSDLGSIDIRFIDVFNHKLTVDTTNEVANFLLKHFIEHPGILIDEDYLAVRLGIDKDKSSNWNTVIDFFGSLGCSYQGIFGDAWIRFWNLTVMDRWKELSGEALRSMVATERVKFLSKHLGIVGLVPLEKQLYCGSDKFWTICDATKVGIDTIDGLLKVNYEGLFVWEEPLYVSPLAAVMGGVSAKVAKSDAYRLEHYKQIYEKTHTRDRK